MPISITPILPVVAADSAVPDLVLQPGTVVDARVIKTLSDNLVRIAISNIATDVLSEIPLVAGQVLQLAVSQTESGIRLAVVGQGAADVAASDTVALAESQSIEATANAPVVAVPPGKLLSPLERIAVSIASESAATRQQSLAPLFANLSIVGASTSIPEKLQQAVAQVLEQRTALDATLKPSDVKDAFQKSGLLLEASLASGSNTSSSGVPDLKAALIVLRQTLVATLALPDTAENIAPLALTPQPSTPAVTLSGADTLSPQAAAPTATLVPSLSPELEVQELLPAQARMVAAGNAIQPGSTTDMSGPAATKADTAAVLPDAALKLLKDMLQPMPRIAATSVLSSLTLPNARGEDLTFHTNTPPPPFRGALPSAQAIAAPSITPDAPLATSAHRLLGDTDAAIARQTLLQVASLPDRVDIPGARSDQVAPRWNFEIPFVTAQGTAMAQFEISRDGGAIEPEAATRVWRARFSLDVEPAGPVHALITLSGERTSVRMWAERPATAAQLRAGAAQLSEALGKAELQPGEIVIRDGAPPSPAPARAGHFLDRAL
jgi:hypothetical protein